MTPDFEKVYELICTWTDSRGIQVRHQRLSANKAGEFDGRSATMNTEYPVEEQCYYLVHAMGSIVRWSLSLAAVQDMFRELRAAKKERETVPDRLEHAIEGYRAFETEASEFAVWLLGELGCGDTVPLYTNFMRADLEALSQFHRHGRAPVWRDFFAYWNEEVRQGRRHVLPFSPKPIPEFEPAQVETQEILQEQPK